MVSLCLATQSARHVPLSPFLFHRDAKRNANCARLPVRWPHCFSVGVALRLCPQIIVFVFFMILIIFVVCLFVFVFFFRGPSPSLALPHPPQNPPTLTHTHLLTTSPPSSTLCDIRWDPASYSPSPAPPPPPHRPPTPPPSHPKNWGPIEAPATVDCICHITGFFCSFFSFSWWFVFLVLICTVFSV